MMTVKIVPNDSGNPPGKLADAELHFTSDGSASSNDADTALSGLKLIGFAIWERRTGGGRNVTFPARAYSVNGERRSFALLRPAGTQTTQDAQNRVRDLILQAYDEYEQAQRKATQAPPAATQDEAAAAQSTDTTRPTDDPPLAFAAAALARELWRAMDDNERHGVKFGLFPARIMPTTLTRTQQTALTVELMNLPTVGKVDQAATRPSATRPQPQQQPFF